MRKCNIILVSIAVLALFASVSATRNFPKAKNVIPGPWNGPKPWNINKGAKVVNGGITLSDYTVKFTYHVPQPWKHWRNLFRVTNTEHNCCNPTDRLINFYIIPNDTRLHLRTASLQNGNDGFDTTPNFHFVPGQSYKVKVVYHGRKATLYVNYIPVHSVTFAKDRRPINNANLYISDLHHESAPTGSMTNFKILDQPLFLDRKSCGDSIFGHLARNRWFTPIRDYSPCGDQRVELTKLFTLHFQYKVGAIPTATENIFRFTNTRHNAGHRGDRQAALWKGANNYDHFLINADSVEHPNAGAWFRVKDVKEGDVIDFRIMYHSDTVYVMANGVTVVTREVKGLYVQKNNVFMVSDAYHKATTGKVKNFRLIKNTLEYPSSNTCNSHVFGIYSENVWRQPTRDSAACPGRLFPQVDNYSIEFDYKPMRKVGHWTNLFHIMPYNYFYNCCNGNTRRQPSVYIIPNTANLHVRVSSSSNANSGVDANFFRFGELYRVKIQVRNGFVEVSANGMTASANIGTVFKADHARAWVSGKWYAEANAEIKRLTMSQGTAFKDHSAACKESPFGEFAENKLNKPSKGYQPCPGTVFNLKTQYTIEFKFRPLQITSGWSNLFRFTTTDHNYNRKGDRIPALFFHSNTFKMHFVIGTRSHHNSNLNPSYQFETDSTYDVIITVDNAWVTIIVDGDEIHRQNMGQAWPWNNVQAYFSDRFHHTTNAYIWNFQVHDSVNRCVIIYSECDFKGDKLSVCESSPNLNNNGWDKPVKSVRIPPNFKKRVVLHTKDGYRGNKLVVTKDIKCVNTDKFSFLQISQHKEE